MNGLANAQRRLPQRLVDRLAQRGGDLALMLQQDRRLHRVRRRVERIGGNLERDDGQRMPPLPQQRTVPRL